MSANANIGLVITARNQAKAAFDQVIGDVRRLRSALGGAGGAGGIGGGGGRGGGFGGLFGGGASGGRAGGVGGGSVFGRASAAAAGAAASVTRLGGAVGRTTTAFGTSAYALRRFTNAAGILKGVSLFGYASLTTIAGTILGLGIAFSIAREQGELAFKSITGSAQFSVEAVNALEVGSRTMIQNFSEIVSASANLMRVGYTFEQTTSLIQNVNDALMQIPGASAEAATAIENAFAMSRETGMGVNNVISTLESQGIPIISKIAKEFNTSNYGVSVFLEKIGGRLPSGMFDDLIQRLIKTDNSFGQWKDTWAGVMAQMRGEIASGFGALLLPFFQKLRDLMFAILSGLQILRGIFANLPQPIKDLVKWGGVLLIILAPLALAFTVLSGIIAGIGGFIGVIVAVAEVVADVVVAVLAFGSGVGEVILFAIAIGAALYMAWTSNFLGIQGIVGAVGGFIANIFTVYIPTAINALAGFVAGIPGFFVDAFNGMINFVGSIPGWLVGVWNGIVTDVNIYLGPLASQVLVIVGQVISDIGNYIGAIPPWLAGIWGGIVSDVSVYLGPLAGAVIGVWNQLLTDAGTYLGGIEGWIQGVWNGVVTDIDTYLGPVLTAVGNVWSGVTGVIGNEAQNIVGWIDWLYNMVYPIVSNIVTIINSIGSGIGGVVGVVAGVARDMINAIIDVINNGIAGIEGGIDGLANTINSSGVVSVPVLTLPRIPRLADGGVTTRAGLAYLHPAEVVQPLDRMNVGMFGRNNNGAQAANAPIILRIDDFEDLVVRTNTMATRRGRTQ